MESKGTVIKKKSKKKKGQTIDLFDDGIAKSQIKPRESQPPTMDPSVGVVSSVAAKRPQLKKPAPLPGGLPGAHLNGANPMSAQLPLPLPGASLSGALPGAQLRGTQPQVPSPYLTGNQGISLNQQSKALLITQAHSLAAQFLPEETRDKFGAILDEMMNNPNFDKQKGSAEMMSLLNPKNDTDFIDYTEPEPPAQTGGLTAYDHRLMDMMEKKIEEEMKRDMEVAQKTQEVCRFYLTGTCKFGKSCKFFHPSQEDHIAEALVFENDQDCCICYEKVLARDRQFGLLTGCDHAFCLECIRKWRGQVNYKSAAKDQYRLCPICRQESYVVIPSNRYVKGEEKQKMMSTYKKRLQEIPCKHFNKGQGKCPFLNSCFYAHKLPDGEKYEYPFSTPEFSMRTEEWNENYEDDQTLSNMLGEI